VFAVAAVYGLVLIAPLYFAEARIGREDPPAVTHPEYFYGFIGVTLAWQLVFLVIARDPVRYRPLMLTAVVEKGAYGIAALGLVVAERASPLLGAFALVDIILGLGFLFAFFVTRGEGRRV
jgi:hypothetical protein